MSTPLPLPTDQPSCTSVPGADKGSSPTYLYRKRSIYYFRYALPKALKRHWGCSEVRISLRTSYLRAAKFRSRMLYAEISKIILDATMLDHKEIRRRMNILLQRMLEQDHNNISERTGISFPDRKIAVSFERLSESQAEILTYWNNNGMILKEVGPEVMMQLLQSGAFELDEITEENALPIVKAFNQIQITAHRIRAARERGDFLLEETITGRDFGKLPYERGETLEPSGSVPMSAPESSTASSGMSLLYSEATERYVNQKLLDRAWEKHSLPDHHERLAGFLEIIGDKPLHGITREDMRTFRETLRKLPPNRSRAKAFKGKSIQELLDLEIEKTLSLKTVNIHVEAVGSMLEWCVREGLLEKNPAKGLQIKDSRQAVELRPAFTREELSKIFAHPKFAQGKFKSPAYYWIPLVALYSGMRLEEIAQLHCKDIYESTTKGIWVFDINGNSVDENNWGKLLKTKNARRLVPLHQTLIDAGFLRYHKAIEQKGHIRLFPDLNKTTKTAKFGKQPSKQFKAVVTEALGDVQGKTFHSLRHTFADFYKQRGLQNDYFRQVFGHELPMLAANQYGEKFPPDLLYNEIISKLDYGIDVQKVLIRS